MLWLEPFVFVTARFRGATSGQFISRLNIQIHSG
jgi:hypothetical protein